MLEGGSRLVFQRGFPIGGRRHVQSGMPVQDNVGECGVAGEIVAVFGCG